MTYLKNDNSRSMVAPDVQQMIKSSGTNAAVELLRKCHGLTTRNSYADGGMVTDYDTDDMGADDQRLAGLTPLKYPAAGR